MRRLMIPSTASPQCIEIPDGVERSRQGSVHARPGQTLTVTDGEAAIITRLVPGIRIAKIREKLEAIEVKLPVEISPAEVVALKADPPPDLVKRKTDEIERRSKRKEP